MNRIRSYTVIEMLVVMLISSLSIAITYTCYTIVSHQYLNYKKNSDELSQFIVLDKLLTKDVSACKKVLKTPLGIDCVLKRESVRYELYNNFILRRSTIIDTFKIGTINTFETKRFGIIENLPEKSIDEITFDIVYKDEKLYFYYKKNYGADVLMSLE